MRYALLTTMLAATLAATSLPASAKVFMCVDPQTGKKTFTDTACPNADAGRRKVRVETVNFGDGVSSKGNRGVWESDRDRSVAGVENYRSGQARREPGNAQR
ncbi:DUF4124 domain-containing protein [Mangrovimicrobium sediminis]|uniref:DUF4124 domain-containing protein n=1 Tax=Mangrovimicrobium sediminis TaxID=2562682 RepID=A0A4Z0M1E5_9GAMM|nr:DUF4124 domain-containing protein [Haliea sp. SAOS-164]TGD73349.1 DUF4124 domain-containing protein [Haliea sp. SAOS-164]